MTTRGGDVVGVIEVVRVSFRRSEYLHLRSASIETKNSNVSCANLDPTQSGFEPLLFWLLARKTRRRNPVASFRVACCGCKNHAEVRNSQISRQVFEVDQKENKKIRGDPQLATCYFSYPQLEIRVATQRIKGSKIRGLTGHALSESSSVQMSHGLQSNCGGKGSSPTGTKLSTPAMLLESV